MDRVMGGVALGAYLAFMVLAFGVRAVVHRRRTGSAGFDGTRGRPGSAEWWAGVSFALAVLAGLVAPALQLAGAVRPLVAHGTLAVTGLVTDGPFAVVRNPVFTAMTIAACGLTSLAPNVVAISGLAVLVVAVLLQVRVVEEPYLARVHGEAYLAYADRVGRLVPGVGRGVRSRRAAWRSSPRS